MRYSADPAMGQNGGITEGRTSAKKYLGGECRVILLTFFPQIVNK